MGLDVPSATSEELNRVAGTAAVTWAQPEAAPLNPTGAASGQEHPSLRDSQPWPLEDGWVSTRHVGEFRGLKSTRLQGAKAEKR